MVEESVGLDKVREEPREEFLGGRFEHENVTRANAVEVRHGDFPLVGATLSEQHLTGFEDPSEARSVRKISQLVPPPERKGLRVKVFEADDPCQPVGFGILRTLLHLANNVGEANPSPSIGQ